MNLVKGQRICDANFLTNTHIHDDHHYNCADAIRRLCTLCICAGNVSKTLHASKLKQLLYKLTRAHAPLLDMLC